MRLHEITSYLETLAPLGTQESYDNSGLIYGDPTTEITKAMIALDCTEAVIDDAITNNCNLVIAHHPIVFKGLKKLTPSSYVERTVIKAIQNNIAIYAIHTNLDNYHLGVNKKIGELLGISSPQILAPVTGKLVKLSVFCPVEHAEIVKTALFQAGAGSIGNYDECSFSTVGSGTFRGNEEANPALGEKGIREKVNEEKIEVILTETAVGKVVCAMKDAHPYEEVAYDLIPLLNENPYSGAGMIGELDDAIMTEDFLRLLKDTFGSPVIRHTELIQPKIKRVAWCGGSGSFLLKSAIRQKADIYITGDFKYHEFFDSDNQIVIADIGHFESEQFTQQLLMDLLQKKFPTFAACLTKVNTNPVKYF